MYIYNLTRPKKTSDQQFKNHYYYNHEAVTWGKAKWINKHKASD